MSGVYPLWHVRSDDEVGADAKLIGIYSSRSLANAAIQRLRNKPGFCDHPDGFDVSYYELDQDNWSEGFVSQEEAADTHAQD